MIHHPIWGLLARPEAKRLFRLMPMLGVVVLALVTGCAHVPATHVSFDPKTHAFNIRSPKDIEITNLVAITYSDGTCNLTIGSYSSRNNLDVIKAIAKANADAAQALANVAVQAVGAAVGAAK